MASFRDAQEAPLRDMLCDYFLLRILCHAVLAQQVLESIVTIQVRGITIYVKLEMKYPSGDVTQF